MKIGLKRKVPVWWLIAMLLVAAGSGCRNRTAEAGESGNAGPEKSTAESIAEADALYGQRKDLANVRRGIIALRQALTRDPANYEAAWKLARLDYFLGSHSKDRAEQDAAYRDGIEAGKSAVLIQGNKADGHFWLGANYGGSAEMSVLAGLSSVQDIRTEMERVIEIDPGYEVGSGYMALGRLYLEVPRVLGGDKKKAIDYLEKGLQVGSGNGLMHLRLAEAYHATGRDRDARKQIDFILKMTPGSDYLPEHEDTVAGAKELEKKLN